MAGSQHLLCIIYMCACARARVLCICSWTSLSYAFWNKTKK